MCVSTPRTIVLRNTNGIQPQHTATHCNTLQHAATRTQYSRTDTSYDYRIQLYTVCIPQYKQSLTDTSLPLPSTPTSAGFCEHTATHCNTRQHTATHCNTLQHTATHCSTLQHTATHCNALQRTATHCNTLQHTAIYCNTHAVFADRHFSASYFHHNQRRLLLAHNLREIVAGVEMWERICSDAILLACVCGCVCVFVCLCVRERVFALGEGARSSARDAY